jgi:hypothetical protein
MHDAKNLTIRDLVSRYGRTRLSRKKNHKNGAKFLQTRPCAFKGLSVGVGDFQLDLIENYYVYQTVCVVV